MYRYHRQEPRPIILLLGWLGSKHAHVSKYKKMWEVGRQATRGGPLAKPLAPAGSRRPAAAAAAFGSSCAAACCRHFHPPSLPAVPCRLPACLPTRLQDLGAQVILHQPSILQTALPGLADPALLRLMRDFTYRYSNLCTVRGEAPPVLVHAMSNAGFVAYGTMLHLTSLLKQVRPAALSPAPGGTAASLEFNPAAWSAGGGGMTARSYGLWGGEGGGRGAPVARRGADGEELHRFVSDPRAMAVLSAFRQVLFNTQGIILDSGKPLIWPQAGS